MTAIDLRLGRWQDVLADVGEVDAVICDAPYSKRTHDGHGTMERHGTGLPPSYDGSERREISYTHWTPADVDAFVDAWAPRNRGWFVCMSDHVLCPSYEAAYQRHGLTAFAPVGILIPGMTVRMAGDGPSSWMLYANVARPKRLSKWGTLPGGYTGGPGERVHIGGKPLWLMRALVRDYTRAGERVVDPCAGAATTLLAAAIERRLAVGAEVDPDTHAVALERIRKGFTPSLFDAPPRSEPSAQAQLFSDLIAAEERSK